VPRKPGVREGEVLTFADMWNRATLNHTRFNLVKKLIQWARSKDPDVSMRAINIIMPYLFSRLAQRLEISAPEQQTLRWEDDAAPVIEGEHADADVLPPPPANGRH
jgi:hypothetical protein